MLALNRSALVCVVWLTWLLADLLAEKLIAPGLTEPGAQHLLLKQGMSSLLLP